jgi:mRNA-degrading endonuclease RelE of RelBE toxin-antitoxin system
MKYKVIWPDDIKKIFSKIDKKVAKRIESKVEQHLALDPIKIGKNLSNDLAGYMTYKVAKKYRVIYQVREKQIEILIIDIDLRKNIYDK